MVERTSDNLNVPGSSKNFRLVVGDSACAPTPNNGNTMGYLPVPEI